MKKSLSLLLLLLCTGLYAQRVSTTNYNGWYQYVGSHKFSDRWGVHLEAQLRRADWIVNPQQLLLRTGLNYHFGPNVSATVGYCFVLTYPYGGQPVKSTFPENRIWEQLQVKTQLDRFEFISRFRAEHRFVNAPVLTDSMQFEPGDAVYTNRFRLLHRVSVPFKGKTIEDRSFYFSAYNEVYINAGKNVGKNIFDQNRAYAAFGYKIPKVGRLEIGYLNQMIFKSDGVHWENNHTLQVVLSSTIEFRKKKG